MKKISVKDSMSVVSFEGKTYIVPTRYAPYDGEPISKRTLTSLEWSASIIINEQTGLLDKARDFRPIYFE